MSPLLLNETTQEGQTPSTSKAGLGCGLCLPGARLGPETSLQDGAQWTWD